MKPQQQLQQDADNSLWSAGDGVGWAWVGSASASQHACCRDGCGRAAVAAPAAQLKPGTAMLNSIASYIMALVL